MNFYKRTKNAKKILVLDLGFLGDTVHLLPALWMIRQSYPEAKLHVVVSEHITSLMKCVPWVDFTWGYMRYPRHATFLENFAIVTKLRREKYDVVINFSGSDRSSFLTFLAGAPERLGRITRRGKRFLSNILFTENIFQPFDQEPIYLQACHCLEKAGFPHSTPQFNTMVEEKHLKELNIPIDNEHYYFHISPFTTVDKKELDLSQLKELIDTLKVHYPSQKIILSCASHLRELNKMDSLLKMLKDPPWKVFPGTLNLVELTALIKYSQMHLSGDTGTLHLAVMSNTPSISWFQPHPSKDWLPIDKKHIVITGSGINDKGFLEGVSTPTIMQSMQALLGR